MLGGGHYSVSKTFAENGVLAANGQDGLKTVALRLGMAVIGPTDRFISIYMRAIATPTFLGQYRCERRSAGELISTARTRSAAATQHARTSWRRMHCWTRSARAIWVVSISS